MFDLGLERTQRGGTGPSHPPPPPPTPVYLDYQTLPSPNLPCFKIQDGSQIFHKNTLSACYAKNTLPLQTPAQ